MEAVTKVLLEQGGLLGALVIALSVAIVRLQWQKDALHQARLDDQKAATKALLDLSDRVHAAVDRVADLAEHLTTSGKKTPP